VPWIRPVVVVLSPQRQGFVPRQVREEILVQKVALGTGLVLRVFLFFIHHHHHHKHQGLGHLARSVSTVTAALANVSSVSRLFSFLVGCSGMILKGFGCVAFFAGVKASSFYIHLSYLAVCSSRRLESFVLWSLKVWPARGPNNLLLNKLLKL